MERKKKNESGNPDFDIMARVKQLMEERNWTQYELVKRSGIAKSTVNTWWNTNSAPGISSIEAMCKAFGISLAQFFTTDNDEVCFPTTYQKNLMSVSDRLNDKQKGTLIDFIESL